MGGRQQAFCVLNAHIRKILAGRNAHVPLKVSRKIILAQANVAGDLIERYLLGYMFFHILDGFVDRRAGDRRNARAGLHQFTQDHVDIDRDPMRILYAGLRLRQPQERLEGILEHSAFAVSNKGALV